MSLRFILLLFIFFTGCLSHAEDTFEVSQQTVLADSVRNYVVVDAPIVALKGVKVIDGTGDAPKVNQTILAENGVITAVGAVGDVRIPKQAKILELQGRTVIPGIVGTHNHMHMPGIHFMPYTAPRMYLGSGVTTIQTTGSARPAREKRLADAIRLGEKVGPEIVHTGPYFSGPGGSPVMIDPQSRQQVADTIAYWTSQGVEWFKAYRHTRPEMLKAIIESAHQHGAKVTGHLCSVTYEEAAQMGIDAVEHGFIHSYDLAEGKKPGECSGSRSFRSEIDVGGEEVERVHRALIDHGVAISTTLSIFEAQVPDRAKADERTLDAMAPVWLERYTNHQKRMAAAGEGWYFKPDWLTHSMQHDYLFYQRGGLLTAGLDPGLHNLPGYGDQRNYELLIEAGFSSQDAIKVMTSNGARLLGRIDRGVLLPGKRADIVVIKGDLERHRAVIREVELVFKEGYGYDSQKLLEDVKGRVGVD